MGKLDGKVVVITGAGRGIGKATALLFAQEGAKVVINDIDETPAQEVVKEIKAKKGQAVAVAADVTRGEEAQKIMDTAAKTFGKIDILVNNAGIIRDAMVHKMTDAQWDVCININLKGTFNCTRAVAPYMMKEGHNGKIVNISSVSGIMGNIGQANYAAAKAGIIGFTRTVAREWHKFGVRCNAIGYGLVDTRLTREKETGDVVWGEKVGIPKKIRDGFIGEMGGAIMTPEQAAKVILFLASEDADFITGNVLNVSAGWYI